MIPRRLTMKVKNLVFLGVFVLGFFYTVSFGRDSRRVSRVAISLGKLPIYFIENHGVFPKEVGYYAQASDKTVFFTSKGVTFALRGKKRRWVVKIDFVDPEPGVEPRGNKKQKAIYSYFKGRPEEWKTGLPTFREVIYKGIWPGIDLVYSGPVNKLKYEFRVSPGADPGRIRFRIRGAKGIHIEDGGSLKIETPEGNIKDGRPYAYQEEEGKRVEVPMKYEYSGSEEKGYTIGFKIGAYDKKKTLILDPAFIVYCGYIGGTSWDEAHGIAVDSSGNVYVTGQTESTEQTFPVVAGPVLKYSGGHRGDVFVAKVNASGKGLVYCGDIGGAKEELGIEIAVDSLGNAYVGGATCSDEKTFPVKGGPDLTFNSGFSDAFIAKVNPSGTELVYCGYIGGAGCDRVTAIAVDAFGNAYMTGGTSSDEKTFPVKVGPDLTYNGHTDFFTGGDAFVAKVNVSGTELVYCGYIGGAEDDFGGGIAVDSFGNAYVTGQTSSDEKTFPVKMGPDLTFNGKSKVFPYYGDAFVAKVNASGKELVYCGYIGGAKGEDGWDIAVDSSGNAYVTGYTESDEKTFPVKVGPDLAFNGWRDAFVAKVNASGDRLIYCGYIGGKKGDYGYAIAVDSLGNAYVTGGTLSDEKTFPVKMGPGLVFNGRSDAFIAKVNAAGKGLVFCGYIGGLKGDIGYGIAVDPSGNAWVTGWTRSDEKTFPVKAGPDLTFNGKKDAFVAKIALTLLEGDKTVVKPGSKVGFMLTSSDDPGLPYVMATSLGKAPIPMGNWNHYPGLDALSWFHFGAKIAIFGWHVGNIGRNGTSKADMNIPNIPSMKSFKIHTAFLTISPTAPMWVKSISNTFTFTIR